MAEKCLYDKLFSKGKDALKDVQAATTKRADKRAFKSAYDSVLSQADQAKQEINRLLEGNIGRYGANDGAVMAQLLNQFDIVAAADSTKEDLAALYKNVFGEELNVEE